MNPWPIVAQKTRDDFTPRQLEVIRLLAESKPSQVIARRLEVTDHTIQYHRKTIYKILGLEADHNIALLTRWAVLRNVIEA
jgi:DNA-binding CsgD family transcriptional regulator